jgi:hypothetical protein
MDDGVVALAATLVDDALTVGFTAAFAAGFAAADFAIAFAAGFTTGFEVAFTAAFGTETAEGFVFDEAGFAGAVGDDFFVAMV